MTVVPMRRVKVGIPTDGDLMGIPLTRPTEFELSDKETARTRIRIYALNKNNARFRWRTMREGGMLLIWRFVK